MASSMDKLAKELKKQMTASDERKPRPYDTQAEVLRVENGVAWVHIPGGVDETPVRLTINAKKGDNVNLHVANGTAWITGNSTNPPTDDSTANYAVNISNEVKKDVTVLNNIVVEEIEATNARFTNVEADTAKIHDLTADKLHATVGYIDDLTADSITANDISAASGYIKDLKADSITAQDISAASGYIKDLEAENITAQDITADHATIDSLDANYAHITDGVIDNAKIGYADVNNLSTNYAQINLANVNNAWIENGVVKDAAISDAQILGVSANKLTAGTIDASNITVTNLNASNITTGSITVDGITIDVENNEASIDGEYIEDGTITLNGLAQEVTDKIDGAIETFTGSAVPTLNNYPASSWTTTKIKDSHIGDVYYVLNTENTADGYCYRFAKDGNTYKWILIKDSDVTAALSRLTTAEGKISGLESFESTTSSWITNTDEELGSIKSNHTSLVTVVDKTVKETVQLWFTKANTTAPSKPTAQVTNNSPTGSNSYNKWNLAVPQYNSSYPNYYYCYQWKYVDGTYGWSAVTRDIAMGESQSTARTAASDASTAVSTAETASTNASNAVSTANTASTNASTALSTASTANTNASTALSTANTAASDASSAVSTANTANSNASSAVTTANAAQTTANANIKSSVQLWFTKANTTAPSKPTAHVTTNDASKANQWNIAVPTYNGTYPNYFYCYEYQKGDGTYAWSNVVYDRATTENQSNSRSALSQVATKVETSTFNTLSQTVDSNTANITSLSNVVETKADSSTVTTLSNTVNEVSQTATGNSSKISSLTNTLGTNADGTTKAGDIVHRTSAVEQDLSGFKTTVSKTYHKTSDFNTYKAANDTAVAAAKKAGDDAQADLDEYKGTVSETYATKSSLTQTAEGIRTDVSSTYETKTDASAKLTEAKGDATTKANKALTDAKADTKNKLKSYYTKTQTDSAITQRAGEISLSVAQTEIGKIEVGGRNYVKDSQDIPLRGKATANWDYYTLTVYHNDTSFEIGDVLTASTNVEVLEGSVSSIAFFLYGKSIEPHRNKSLVVAADIVNGKAVAQLTLNNNYGGDGNKDFDLLIYQGVAGSTAGNRIKLNNVKLEKGNKVTDWTPAPEDVEAYTDTQVLAAKAEIKVTTDGISTEVAKKTDKETIISTIRQSAESVKIKASQVEIDGTATFNAIKPNADAAYDAKGAASAAESNAKDYADGAVADKADKSNAVARTQRIYYRKTSSGAPSANKTWLATSGTGYGNWSLKVPQMTSGTTKYPYLYTAVQTQTVAQMAAGNACSCSAVLLDDTTTVIDGGHITTGTIDSNRLNADTIKVNAANIQGSLTIGQLPSTVAETSDIPTKVSELSNDSGYQTSSQVSSAINNVRSWYATCSTAAGTAAKVATITPTTTAFTTSVLTAGTLVNVKFTVTNTAAVAGLTLNINNTGAKHIKTLRYGVINNIAGAGYLAKDTTYQFTYDGTYWVMQENYNSDTQNRIRWQNVIAAAEAITSGHIICGTASGYRNIAANVSFDMAYPLLYAATAIAKGATSGTRDNNFLEINGINASSNGTITSGAANKVLYLKGTISGNTFTISASPFMTTAVPSSQDNICYIPIGIMYSATNIYFKSSDQIYAYKDGAFGQISLREASAAAKTATTYITHIDNNGIRVHPSSTQNNSVVINAKGMEVFKGGTDDEYSVAKYGDTARIGKESGSHLTLAPDSMSMSDGTKDVFNLLQKTMYIYWNRNYKGRQFANSTDRHVDAWETNTTISTWDSIAVNYKLNNTSKTKKITSISNGVLVNDEIYVHFNYSGTKITLTYGRGSSAASSDIIKLESAVVYYVTDEKLSQLHTGTYPNTTVSGALRIGNGTSDSNRRNLMLVDWSGTGKFKGDILAFCGADSSGGMSLTKAEENIDAFKYQDANGYVYINAYRVGRIVSLLCTVSKTPSTAVGANLYQLNLTNAHLPKPLGTNTSGTGIYSSNMIIGNIYYNRTVTPNRYEFICRNGGSKAVSTVSVGFTITYICQMDEVSGEIKYMDD